MAAVKLVEFDCFFGGVFGGEILDHHATAPVLLAEVDLPTGPVEQVELDGRILLPLPLLFLLPLLPLHSVPSPHPSDPAEPS